MTTARTTPLRERMRQDLQLAGLSECTQETYLRAVSQLARHFGQSPDTITEERLRAYFLHLKNEKHEDLYWMRPLLEVSSRGV